MIGIKDQNFGVEVEMTGITRREAAKALANYFGTEPMHPGGTYDKWTVRDNDGKEWTIASDSSIREERHTGHREYEPVYDTEYRVEMVTPILTYSELPKFQECIRQVRHAGAKVNDSCGLHVHVDAAEQRKRYGFTQKAVGETIRICIERGVLAPFLMSREKEVIQIMNMLFSQEEITKIREFNLVKDAKAEGRMEGLMEGQEKERENNISALIRELRAQGMDKAQITAFVKRMYSFSPAIATEKVQKYWLAN